MTTPPLDGRRSPWRSRWAMPAFCLFLALLIFGAFALGGRAADGIAPALILVAVGAVFAFGGRSETLRGIGGQETGVLLTVVADGDGSLTEVDDLHRVR